MSRKGGQMPSIGRPATRAQNQTAHPGFDTGYRKAWRKNRTLKVAQKQKKLTSRVAEIEDDLRREDERFEAKANHPIDIALVQEHDEEHDAHEMQSDSGEDQSGVYADEDESEDEQSDAASEVEPKKPRGRPTAVKSASKKAPKPSRSDVAAQRQTITVLPKSRVRRPSAKHRPVNSMSTTKKTKSSKKSGLAATARTPSPVSARSMAVDSDDDDRMVKQGGPAIDDDVKERVKLKQSKGKKRGKPVESVIKVTLPPKPPTLKELRNGRPKWTTNDLPLGAALRFKGDVTPLIRELMGFQNDPWARPTDDAVQDLLDMVYDEDAPVHDIDDPVWQGLIAYRLNDWRGALAAQAIKGIQVMIDEAKKKPPPDASSSHPPATESVHPDDDDEAAAPEGSVSEDAEASVPGGSEDEDDGAAAPDDEEDEEDEDEDEDEEFDLRTPEGVAAFAEWALQVVDHTSPFHWKKWGKGVRKVGLFEGDLILYTFATHLAAIATIPSKYPCADPPNPPVGAIILCIQAVERALRAWRTGELMLSSKPIDYFSKDHWADTTKQRNGKDVKDRRATKYVSTLRDFDDDQWHAIYETVLGWVEKKKGSGSSRSSSMDASMAELESDEEDHSVLKADIHSDQKKLFHLAGAKKVVYEREWRGEQMIIVMVPAELAETLFRISHDAVVDAGGIAAWEQLSDEEHREHHLAAFKKFVQHIRQEAFDKLSVGTDAATRAEDRSCGGAIKVASLAGAIFRHKDRKRGQQDTLRYFWDNETGFTICFPDTSNTRFQSHAAACEIIVLHMDLLSQFLVYVRENKISRTLNNMEANVEKGFVCWYTQHEFVAVALLNQNHDAPYLITVRGLRGEKNFLKLGEFHENVKAHLRRIIANPKLITSPDMTHQTATLDGKPWTKPEVVYAALAMISRWGLTHIDSIIVAFCQGALDDWDSFSEEWKEDGAIAKLSPENIERAWLKVTNDGNESELGIYHQAARSAPNMSLGIHSALRMYKANETSAYLKTLAPSDRQFMRAQVRKEDSSGHIKEMKHSLIVHMKEVADNSAVKDAARTERLRIPPRSDGYLSAPELHLQLDWHVANPIRVSPDSAETSASLIPKAKTGVNDRGNRDMCYQHLRAVIKRCAEVIQTLGSVPIPEIPPQNSATDPMPVDDDGYDSEEDWYSGCLAYLVCVKFCHNKYFAAASPGVRAWNPAPLSLPLGHQSQIFFIGVLLSAYRMSLVFLCALPLEWDTFGKKIWGIWPTLPLHSHPACLGMFPGDLG
ncbi:hypothetical protein B0H17DRAFT_1136218 [Mycena rosella]|uniref:Uncharacterized protein n=1 Tax=Mycena rosella TaxID=1033263 RepID=A0AAD7DEE3_MYCRO|nr:hypothetical protein B0H17DRAFT_1136218 [Mycena rosella]